MRWIEPKFSSRFVELILCFSFLFIYLLLLLLLLLLFYYYYLLFFCRGGVWLTCICECSLHAGVYDIHAFFQVKILGKENLSTLNRNRTHDLAARHQLCKARSMCKSPVGIHNKVQQLHVHLDDL